MESTLARAIAKDVAAAGALGFLGDVVCQCGFEGATGATLDRGRLGALTAFSAGYIGVVCGRVYTLYPPVARFVHARLLPAPMAAGVGFATTEAVVSCGLDNFVHVPCLYLPSYYLAVGTMRGDSLAHTWRTLQEQYVSTMTSCWGFWVPVMLFNFRVVPPAFRVRVVATANFVWSVALDWMAWHGTRSGQGK